MAEAGETESVTRAEQTHEIVSRVLNLSIFFVGVGVFAVAGLALYQAGLLESYQLTYFAVGLVFGVVGLLLGLITR